ncbi:helix-turn-helix domain-containing protein [Microcoleus sp. FACHB-831]|uniref:helix-turn-helix domain-containing protein n=1 Tax=Microcoleus sp. FACHB-831 TaxID=2692827 RepID=UPI001F557353|nr:helix-turn-helix domain-containing protein [Microcoleus sp. FACHB-831]
MTNNYFMFDSLSTQLPTISSLLFVGGIFFVMVYFRGGTSRETKFLKYDEMLRDRMASLGIASFTRLQEKAGLTSLRLRQVRRGNIAELRLNQLNKLAFALNWNAAELLQNLGVVPPPSRQEIESLRLECLRLRDELEQQKTQLTAEVINSTFQTLQTLLTNYPSIREMVQVKPELPAKNLLSLFTPLDNLISSWGYETIGEAWKQVEYNPQLHQPDAGDIAPGELVYVRFIGYKEGERILIPAKVSRTLPGGGK